MGANHMTRPSALSALLLLCCVECLFVLLCQAGAVPNPNTGAPRLIAISDLHGDISACRDVLRAAAIIDQQGHWIAGNSTVVQLGDIADRGRHHHEIYELFNLLEMEAKEVGGEFIFLIGNHELMNLLGQLRFVHRSLLSVFGGSELYTSIFRPNGAYGSLILRHPVTVVRDGVVFVHASIMPEYASLGVNAINDAFLKAFQNYSSPQNAIGKRYEVPSHPFENLRSPLWSRRVLQEAARGNCSLLDESLRLLSLSETAAGRPPVHVMIGGHTIQEGGTVSLLCGGRLVAADVGLSRYLNLQGGHLAFVEFILDNASKSRRRVPHPVYPYGAGYQTLLEADEEPRPPRLISPVMKTRIRRAQSQKEGSIASSIELLPLLLLLISAVLAVFTFQRKKILRRNLFGINRKEF